VHVVPLATTSDRLPPPAQEPIVRPLPGPGGAPVALLHVALPAATVLPPHDHGRSYVVLIPLHGGVVVEHGGGEHGLVPGSAAYLDVGTPIGFANRGADAAELCVVVTPPDVAEAVAR
jgi:quercetin dioxygenase-like cupin family protein